MALSLILFSLGVGLISLLLILNRQVEEKFEKNLAGIHLIVGAKGSPLQSILCNMYHIDAPNGNIKIGKAKAYMSKNPLIRLAVPLSVGDSYKRFRIVGTTHELVDSVYYGKIAEGKLWQKDLEVTIGAAVAEDLNLGIGQTFLSSHGFVDDEMSTELAHGHDASPFTVVGILEPSGTVLDQLILCSSQSVWKVHDHDHGPPSLDDLDIEEEVEDEHAGHNHDGHNHDDHAHEEVVPDDGHNHDDHNHEGHDHDDHDHAHHDHAHHDHPVVQKPLIEEVDKDITAILIKFRNHNVRTLNMGRLINENTDMLATNPAIEINRLRANMGLGTDALRVLALVIIFVSALSIFISLYSSLKERKYELALMRVMGGTRNKLFLLIILEGIILAILGFIIGMILSHFAMGILANFMKDSYRYSFSGMFFMKEEIWLFFGAIAIGLLAALIPAIQASNTDISETLSDI